MNKRLILVLSMSIVSMYSVSASAKLADPEAFARTIDDKEVRLETLQNSNGLVLQATNYGARIVRLLVPDRDDQLGDIVTGFPTLEGYIEAGEPYHGCVVGRYGNRIAKGRFVLDGQQYTLGINNGENHLHGGPKGYQSVVWDMEKVDAHTLRFTHVSPHLDQGYPGELRIRMDYQLTDENELKITYHATTDRKTVVNLTHHSFFNLSGNGTINNHVLFINADFCTPTDAGLIPTGEILSVEGTPMDFRKPTRIGARVNDAFEALKFAKGYDHNWVIRRKTEHEVELVASLYDPKSGRVMEILTDQPGLQFYGGNFFDGGNTGKYGVSYGFREALALETQHFPDSPNQPHFPSTTLNPGETYQHTCVYRFSAK